MARLPHTRFLVVLALLLALVAVARSLSGDRRRPRRPDTGAPDRPGGPDQHHSPRPDRPRRRLVGVRGLPLVAAALLPLVALGLVVSALVVHGSTSTPALSSTSPATTTAVVASSRTRSLEAIPLRAAAQPTPFACGDDDGAAGRLAVRNERADIDGDGSVTTEDLFLVLRGIYLSGMGRLTPEQVAKLDVNRDGSVTVQDALEALRYALEPNDCAARANG